MFSLQHLKTMFPLAKLIGSALMAMSVTACMVGPDFVQPTAKLQDDYARAAQSEFTESFNSSKDKLLNPVTWWTSFKDPTLNQLLKRAADENLSLQSAALRIFQARAQLGVADASLLPVVNLTGSSTQNNMPSQGTSPLMSSGVSVTNNALLTASWEIDFWGKYRRGIESSLSTYIATVATFYSADVSLAADVANTYINIRNFDTLISVAKTNLALQEESLRIADSRFKNGATSLLDLNQAQALYEQTKSQIPGLIASLKKNHYAMSILLGETPDYYEKTFGSTVGSLSSPPELDVGIPKDLLRRRPDVLQAEFEAAAQSALIGVNVANLYPSFSLSGYFGFQTITPSGSSTPSLFSWDNKTTSLAGGFTFPVFYRGAIVDQIRVQDAVFQQSILSYQNKVLNAQKEVQEALITISTTRSASADLKKAVVAAQSAADLALQRYKGGQSDYSTVIQAQQQLLSIQNSAVQSNTSNLLGYVSAFKSLGGGWSGEMKIPALPVAMVGEMEKRTDWGKALMLSNDPRLVQPSENKQ
jgi:NodT family efflux transporter outer membrane factor (OMF) lipoprotein